MEKTNSFVKSSILSSKDGVSFNEVFLNKMKSFLSFFKGKQNKPFREQDKFGRKAPQAEILARANQGKHRKKAQTGRE